MALDLFGFGWGERGDAALQMCNLAEINRPHLRLQAGSMGEGKVPCMQAVTGSCIPGLSLMVWILKREVRAFGGCLGTYRR
jgi:hypothetical protein